MLTKDQIKSLFLKLNGKLETAGVTGEVGIVDGAVMCLVFNTRQATKDIDGIFAPTQKMRKLIKEIAAEEDVPEDWLNDGAKGYIQGDFNKIEVLSLSHLRVWAPQPEYMLAMKCISARIDTKDADDVRFLIRRLKLKSPAAVFGLVAKYYPRNNIPAKTQFFVEELFEKRPAAKNLASETIKVHPWRMCAEGEHWVITHPLRVPPSQSNPGGSTTTRHGHCARNPSGKDQIHAAEIGEITSKHFENLKSKPCPLPLGFKNGSSYDDLIAGWVQYWNDVLKPDQPLGPNIIKALIASESGFQPSKLFDKSDPDSARGLMQITDEARKILGNEKGEIKNHFVTVSQEDLNNPSVNICAGIRWLFRKRDLASNRLKRSATWIEAVEEYKGDLKGVLKNNKKSQKDIAPFLKYYEKAQRCET